MQVAVTGANGMIGRYLVHRLVASGYKVRVLVRDQLYSGDSVEIITGNLTDERVMRKLVEGVVVLYHCAAELSSESEMQAINSVAVKSLSMYAVKAGVQTFCHISSAGVIGASTERWVSESSLCRPISLYERTKWEAEQYLKDVDSNKMRVCMLRPTNVIDDEKPGVLMLALRSTLSDKIAIFLKGNERAHLVHADDVAGAALFVAENASCSGVYFVGQDEEECNSVAGVCSKVYQYMGAKMPVQRCLPVTIPYLLRRLMRGKSLHGRTRFSSSRLLSAGYVFELGIDGAIQRVVSSYRENAC